MRDDHLAQVEVRSKVKCVAKHLSQRAETDDLRGERETKTNISALIFSVFNQSVRQSSIISSACVAVPLT